MSTSRCEQKAKMNLSFSPPMITRRLVPFCSNKNLPPHFREGPISEILGRTSDFLNNSGFGFGNCVECPGVSSGELSGVSAGGNG